jgi:hypothetical protein
MLWFNIGLVALLAFIPVLIIVAQTTTVFDKGKYLGYIQYSICLFQAINYPFGYGFWVCLVCVVGTLYYLEVAEK